MIRTEHEVESAIGDLIMWRNAARAGPCPDWTPERAKRADRVIAALEWVVGRRGDLTIHPDRITAPADQIP